MPVYSKRANPAQREAMQSYEAISGFEAMLQDDFDAGRVSFEALWTLNVQWLEDMVGDVQNISLSDEALEWSDEDQTVVGGLG